MVLLVAACIDLSAQRPLLRQRCDAEFFIIRQQRGVPLDAFDFDRSVESNEMEHVSAGSLIV